MEGRNLGMSKDPAAIFPKITPRSPSPILPSHSTLLTLLPSLDGKDLTDCFYKRTTIQKTNTRRWTFSLCPKDFAYEKEGNEVINPLPCNYPIC